MSDISNSFKYEYYLERDFFGKIMPGGILLCFIIYSNTSIETINNLLSNVSIAVYIFLTGMSWILGLIIHAIGVYSRIYKNSAKISNDNFPILLHDFKIKADNSEWRHYERLYTIKECSCNSCTSIILCIVYYFITNYKSITFEEVISYNNISTIILLLFCSFILFLVHRRTRFLQEKWMEKVIDTTIQNGLPITRQQDEQPPKQQGGTTS